MAKYTKKLVIIEAEQWYPGDICFRDVFGNDVDKCGVCYNNHKINSYRIINPHIHKLESVIEVTSDNWIIIDSKGERYVCKPDIFKMTYDLVKDNTIIDFTYCHSRYCYDKDHRCCIDNCEKCGNSKN